MYLRREFDSGIGPTCILILIQIWQFSDVQFSPEKFRSQDFHQYSQDDHQDSPDCHHGGQDGQNESQHSNHDSQDGHHYGQYGHQNGLGNLQNSQVAQKESQDTLGFSDSKTCQG